MSQDDTLSQMDAEKKSEEIITRKPSVAEGTVTSHQGANPPDFNQLAINNAIEAIGMGRYQWQLMVSCGFGFIADQMLLVSISLVMPQASKEFGPRYGTLLSATQYAGLGAGAVVFGLIADFTGRRLAWQTSIFGVSIFTAICAASPNWAALNIFVVLAAFFGGGNSWPLVVNFCCPAGATPETCTKANNMGWRYLYIILGGLCLVMSVLRTFALGMSESPKWLVSRGELNEAVASINTISKVNKSTYVMMVDQLRPHEQDDSQSAIKKAASMVGALFHGSKQIRSMICLILLWLLIGIAYPVYTVFLPYYLEAHGATLGDGSTYQTYRDWSISSVVGIWGPILSAFLVQVPFLGRRRSMTLTACACAAFAGAFTTVKNESQNLAFSCMINFWLNALYGIIYGYTPEIMPDAYRGIGCGLTLACGRIASLSAPFIATFGDVTTSVPIWVCCAFFVVIGFVSLALPFEPGDS
ncbi:major facilitator superfamily domain-containing protein [Aspergillus pseudotamarii]|uniref:Major facilitator superfamily domain-containing protein n=1 Tax=Aspergillus pseudotamarii TaxID=132259 RepID=A0A5N6T0T2_ASPPS|nr:major facilitator superfamily domain-containing protein [Aspergillus pseudotamarii]KAE8140037.1 major facilitator superfamily domain-containing protein [Aspergillus pseudotamarii]